MADQDRAATAMPERMVWARADWPESAGEGAEEKEEGEEEGEDSRRRDCHSAAPPLPLVAV